MKRKTKAIAAATLAAAFVLTGCNSADRASRNLSTAADNFEINRRVVFMNGITDTYMLEIQGACSITADAADGQIEVTCRLGDDEYKKHYLGLSDNVTYFVEQLDAVDVSRYHYRVIFQPEAIIPDIDIETGKQ